MLKKVKVTGLNQRVDVDLDFHQDLNIITGRNGSGKTTLLKLIWYLLSANIERVIPEILFESVYLETDKYYIAIKNTQKGWDVKQDTFFNLDNLEFELDEAETESAKIAPRRIRDNLEPKLEVRWDFGRGEKKKIIKSIKEFNMGLAEYLNHYSANITPPTIFFPTFRRIEGGFSIDQYTRRNAKNIRYQGRNPINQAIGEVSSNLSVFQHQFVTSISTDDIVELLTRQYADVSEQTNRLNSELSEFINTTISKYSSMLFSNEAESLGKTKNVLSQIQKRVTKNQTSIEKLLRPFNILSSLIEDIFQYKGIKMTEGITLGDAADAISSDKLSSGEKQMLSFLCYNAFAKDSIIFVDEPELSLHVDWQRILFPTLLNQQTNNQFIVATHSPFIYSKFPDKELVLTDDKGGGE
jgi:predicted ATPase